jgi:hypothetical protein
MRIGQRMRIDHQTAEVVAALREVDVEPVLLKGPAVARWLYDGPGERTYVDIDLLVPPDCFDTAEERLIAEGFRAWDEGPSADHAVTLVRPGDHASVDLHRCLHGTEAAAPELVRAAVWTDHDELELGSCTVAVPSVPVRLLHAVLHLRPKDQAGSQAWTDLERAVQREPLEAWRRAVDIGRTLGVDGDIGPLLRLVGGGADLADQLGLSRKPSEGLLCEHRRNAPGLSRTRHRLHGLAPTERLRLLRRIVLPPADAMRRSYPVASKGSSGLVLAYLWRPCSVLGDWIGHRRRTGGRPTLR